MYFMKKCLTAITIAVGLSFTLQAQNVFIRQKNNAQSTYAITNVKSIKFSPGNASVHLNNNAVFNYKLDSLRYISFKDLVVSITPQNEGQAIACLVYPNPSSQFLNISIAQSLNEQVRIDIYSIDGKRVIQKIFPTQSHNHTINVSALNSGAYLCNVNVGNKSQTVKFIKE